MAPDKKASPKLWILSKGRKGDLDQMLALAQALGWPFETKLLSFRPPEIPPLAPLLLKDSSALEPPWPDMILCAEAMSSAIALQLKRRSGGRIKALCLGRPAGSTRDFDLVVTTAQYRIPAAPNVLELSLPVSPPREAEGEAYPHDGPRPLIAAIIGGPAFPDRLDPQSARAMMARFQADAGRRGGRLAVHTSPRTPPEVASAIADAVALPHRAHLYAQGSNLYRALLAAADEITVTSDSVSMVADALATGKPVSIYPLPQQKTLKWRTGEWLRSRAQQGGSALFAPLRRAFDSGLIEAAADRRLLFERLAQEGRIAWYGETPPRPQPRLAAQELAKAVERARALMT